MGGHRPPHAELLSLPTAAALQSTPALQPLVASVLARWRRHQKVAAADCDLEADEVSELQARAVTCAVTVLLPVLLHVRHMHGMLRTRICICHGTPCSRACRTPMRRAYHDTMQEQLEALAEAYADPEAETPGSDDEGDAEID